MDNTILSKLNKHTICKILIGVFCAFMAICVVFVMLQTYNPEQNSLNALSSVCMDVVCMTILFILIGSFAFGNYGSNRTTRLFAALLLATEWALFTDFLNWAYDGSLERGNITFWFTVGSLCMGSVQACILSLYLYSYMDEMHSLSKMKKISTVCAHVNICSFAITFVLAMTGNAFTFVDGHYETGALYDMVTVFPVLTLLAMGVYIICYVKTIGWHDVIAVVGYMLFMIVGALIEGENSIGTTYVAIAIADIYIFVMLQNEIIATEKRNVQEWMKKSNTDELTGFYNRNAYETDLKKMENGIQNENFVYISIDVNSLKSVNDVLGHNAGDELLIGAADCLRRCLSPYGKVYRIGGDEFSALIYADEEQLTKICSAIEEQTENWSGKMVHSLALSYGYVTRKEADRMSVRQMAVVADKRMYEAKNEYYRRTGIERRRK